jgi:predicted DNA-binding transcriptional regulator AlpA
MSSAPTRQARIPVPTHENRWSDHRASSSQFGAKKPPASEKSADHRSNGVSNDSDDVVFLRLPEVKAVTGLSKTTLYALIHDKSFPAPVRLSPGTVAWVRSEVRQWAQERVQASRSAA